MKDIISVIMEFPIRVSVFDKLLSLSVCLFVVVFFLLSCCCQLIILANIVVCIVNGLNPDLTFKRAVFNRLGVGSPEKDCCR